jgi:hypothetical protein
MSSSCEGPPLGAPVYSSARPDAVEYPVEFVPMERLAQDDELVYRVTSGSAPTLLSTRALAGKKSLSFQGLLAGVYGFCFCFCFRFLQIVEQRIASCPSSTCATTTFHITL